MPASAFSGAEFLGAEKGFANGYAWGAFEGRTLIASDSEQGQADQLAIWECFNSAGVDSTAFADGVRDFIRSDAKNLTEPAMAAVLRTISRMCPQ